MNTCQRTKLSPGLVSESPATRVLWTMSNPLATPVPSHARERTGTLNMPDSMTKAHPRRTVLRKIAARRERTERLAARPGWATFLVGKSSGLGHPARGLPHIGQRILTPREMEILHLVARGETDRRIADRLYLSRRTVNSHVSNILAKLDVPSRRAAVIVAARIGLL
jgi:DNA-binding CsgD family transcriptional regulator